MESRGKKYAIVLRMSSKSEPNKEMKGIDKGKQIVEPNKESILEHERIFKRYGFNEWKLSLADGTLQIIPLQYAIG